MFIIPSIKKLHVISFLLNWHQLTGMEIKVNKQQQQKKIEEMYYGVHSLKVVGVLTS